MTFFVFDTSFIISLNSVSILSNLSESSGSCFLMSSDPMNIDSRWVHVLCTSNHVVITWSTRHNVFCQADISFRKYPMNFEVIMFWSWTWFSSRVSINSSLALNKLQPVLGWFSWVNSMVFQVTSSSFSIFSIAISLHALSTILWTSSSKLCRLRLRRSARFVSSLMMNWTLVAWTSCSQCLSLIAGFCSSPTALRDVSIFFTVSSSPVNAFHCLISLSKPLISLANFLHSMSIFSTSMFIHRVVFHSSILVLTRKM